MKKEMVLLTLALLACITLDAARRRKAVDSSEVNGRSFANSDFKKISKDNALAIIDLIFAAQTIEDANKKLAKLEELRNVVTKSEAINVLILNDLALALDVFRRASQYDDAFKAAQRNVAELLDNLVDRIQIAKASLKTLKAFEDLRGAVNAAITRKAEALSKGEQLSHQKSSLKQDELKGWFASAFIIPTKPEAATEKTSTKKRVRALSIKRTK
jgi:hypothetical protein